MNLFEQQAKQLAEVRQLTQPVTTAIEREVKNGNVVVLLCANKPKGFDGDFTPPEAA